jgi:signal transduction histidine kinase
VVEVPVRPVPGAAMSIVRVREPLAESQGRFRTSLLLLAGAAVGVVAIAALAGAIFAWRLGRRVDHVRRWATGVGPDVSAAPAPTGIGELDDLGAAVAEAHGRIQELLQRERSFSSHVSHQLRTPVAAMRVAVETELAAPRTDPTLVLHESLQALDRLESTITSLLALTRQPGREPVAVDLTQVVEDQDRRWAPLLQAAGRQLLTTGQPVQARLDESCVQHILDVLLDNALVHGAGVVTLAAAVRAGHVELEVRDEGGGGAGNDPFAEGGAGSGYGIGLRLARSLAESIGGRLEQLDGPRTTFRLSVPTAP